MLSSTGRIVTISDKLRCYEAATGKVLWEDDGGHLQLLCPGRYIDNGEPYQIMALDVRSNAPDFLIGCKTALGKNPNAGLTHTVRLYDLGGKKLWEHETAKTLDDASFMQRVDWRGDGFDCILFHGGRDANGNREAIILDGHNRVVERFPTLDEAGNPANHLFMPMAANLTGDRREEVVFSDRFGNVQIYTNAAFRYDRRLANGTVTYYMGGEY